MDSEGDFQMEQTKDIVEERLPEPRVPEPLPRSLQWVDGKLVIFDRRDDNG